MTAPDDPSAEDRPSPPSTRRRVALERALFALLLLIAVALLAHLSVRYARTVDWTDNARNTLSDASRAVLAAMPDPIRITAFVNDNRQLREAVRQLIERYQRAHPALGLELVNPELEPRRASDAGIEGNGALLIGYREREEIVSALSERSVSSALNRLARADQRWIAYLSGAGQRDLLGERRTDLGRFGKHLSAIGFKLRPLELGTAATTVPDNVTLLVVLEPREPLPDAAIDALERYLDGGGNVLWLSDAAHHASLSRLEALLGVVRERGLLVDPNSRLNGQATPEFIQIDGYAEHAVTRALDAPSVFPTAISLRWSAPEGFRAKGLAASALTSWLETGRLDAAVRFDDADDTPGPLDLMLAMERDRENATPQRILVVGDADFLSNAYLGLAANRNLGDAAVSWLAHDDALVEVPTLVAPDLAFAPSAAARATIGLGAPLALPVLVFLIGALAWRRRRRA